MDHGIEKHGSRTRLIVENIKCGGCANTITKGLNELGLKDVIVDPQASFVEMDNPASTEILQKAIAKLRSLGYPLVDTEEGLKAVALKAKSYLSCALGKI
jgi:copper chaperone